MYIKCNKLLKIKYIVHKKVLVVVIVLLNFFLVSLVNYF
jgi:hypothetical protein